MKIQVLVENTSFDEFEGEHGLCFFVEYKDRKYLIDSGASGLYAENAKKLGIDLSAVEKAFLSHAHYDHSGGYVEFFEANTKAKVFLQKSAKNSCCFKLGKTKKYIGMPEGIQEKYKERFAYVDGYLDMGDGIYILPHTTPNLEERGKRAHMACVVDGKTITDNFSHEQTLVFREEDGLVLFNSCSHAGVENILEEVKEVFPKDRIKAFFGGFHMMGTMGPTTCNFEKQEVVEIAEQIKKSSDATFYSGHCTGQIAFAWLQEVLGDRIVEMHAGMQVEIV